MEDYTRERRGVFSGLKVPFCLNAVILAFIGMWLFRGGVMLIENVLQVMDTERFSYVIRWLMHSNPLTGWILPLFGVYSQPEMMTPFWLIIIIYGLWFLICWGLFAGAINRIYAIRIARDETLELGRAFSFGAMRWFTHMASIIFIALAIIFFYLCNVLAGLIGAIPIVGEFIMIPLYFLALISALLITLLLVGVFFGWNLISSAIAVDGVDTFDAISRAYSYVFGRPWQILLYTILPVLFLFVFFVFAGIFTEISIRSVSHIMGDKWKSAGVHAATYTPDPSLAYRLGREWGINPGNPYKIKPDPIETREYDEAMESLKDAFDGERAFNMNELSNKRLMNAINAAGVDLGKKIDTKLYERVQKVIEKPISEQMYIDALTHLNTCFETNKVPTLNMMDNPAFRNALENANYRTGGPLDENTYEKAYAELAPSGMVRFAGYIYAIILWIVSQFVFAFMIAYWLGAQTKAYFLLRHDVDGDDFEEMYTDEEEEEPFSFEAPAATAEEKKEEKPEEKPEKEKKEKKPAKKAAKKATKKPKKSTKKKTDKDKDKDKD